MRVIEVAIEDIKPYENNPRRNDDAVDAVVESIRQFGWKQPIVIDKDGVIVAGHTRYKAAQKLGCETVPCVKADDLTDEQVKAYRLVDNRSADFAEWDFDILDDELANIVNIDFDEFKFDEIGTAGLIDDEEDQTEKEQKYCQKTDIPQYEITGACPELSELVDKQRSENLVKEIQASNVTKDEKEFLICAAQRHNIFNYRNIAEYYAHASPEMQRLMEQSALVIIDIDDAIKYGYAKLEKEVAEIMDEGE